MSLNYNELPASNNNGNQNQPPPAAENKQQSDPPGQQAGQRSPTASDQLPSLRPPPQQLRGDLCLDVRRAIAETASCGKRDLREAVLAGQENLRAELSGPHTTPLQQLVINRLLNSAMALDSLDLEAARQPAHSPGRSSALSAVQDRAHRRFHRAVSALAALQRTEQPLKVELSLVEQLRALNAAQEAMKCIDLGENVE